MPDTWLLPWLRLVRSVFRHLFLWHLGHITCTWWQAPDTRLGSIQVSNILPGYLL